MIIYGSSLSPYVRKVLGVAGEKGIKLDLRPTGFPNHSAEFLEASPFRKMPALRDGDFTLADSSAIIHYLEAKHPEPALIPTDPQLRGKTIWYEEFADTILVSCGAKIFFNRIVRPRFMGVPCNEDEVQQAELNDLPPILDYLEKIVPGDGGYLVGDRLTLADIAVASPSRTSATRRRDYPRSAIRAPFPMSTASSPGRASPPGSSAKRRCSPSKRRRNAALRQGSAAL